MDDTERFCFKENFCTARCNCWDGEAVRRNDTESFDLNDIEDQGIHMQFSVYIYQYVIILHHLVHFLLLTDQNPVLGISQQVLQDEVSIIGDPVAAFLASDEFTSVAPNGIQVLETLQ